MSHTLYKINCRKCGKQYCLLCKGECPECGEVNSLDAKRKIEIEAMRKHMSGPVCFN